jgi:hypothetical protein
MAITKQTAKRSTGGKAPRAALAILAARNPRVLRAPDVGVDEWALHRWIMFTGATVNPWVYQPANQALPPVPFAEGSRTVPDNIRSWCRANPQVLLSTEQCDRWGLTVESDEDAPNQDENGNCNEQSEDDDADDQHHDNDEDDDDDDDDDDDEEDVDDDDDEADDGGDGFSAASPPEKSKDLIVSSIKYDGHQNRYLGRGERGQWFPLIFRMLQICDDAAENMRQLRKLDEWCIENPGLPKQLPLGWRPETERDLVLFTEITIRYRSSNMNCVVLSASNCIAGCDPGTAELVSKCGDNFNSLRRFSAWFNHTTRWGTRDVFKMIQDISGSYPSPKIVMEYIISRKDGVYVVQPMDSDGNSAHAIGVNCFNNTIHDCVEQFAMTLSVDSLTFSCGQGHRCVGFIAAYQLYMKPKRQGKISRKNKE